MNWTFGILTGGNQDHFLQQVVDSIQSLNIPQDKYEILIVGQTGVQSHNTRLIPFQDPHNKIWITKKKNILVQNAKFQNIVLTHDYVVFDKDWYTNFIPFGEDWDVCMNRIVNLDGLRFRDWTTWPPGFVPYDDISKTDQMYVSGTYWCAKKDFMLANPLDENLMWCESEDVEWSLRVRNFWKYRANPKSIVRFLKQKEHNPQAVPGI
jgi:hypothetical protein